MPTGVQITSTFIEFRFVSLFKYLLFHFPHAKFLYVNCKFCKAPGYLYYKNVHIPSISGS